MAQINKPSEYFNTVLYTGNGATQTITTGFQPDWTWTKIRNTTGNHREQDSVRGIGKELYPNLTNVEDTNASQAITSTLLDTILVQIQELIIMEVLM
jgi:hypothetical protein